MKSTTEASVKPVVAVNCAEEDAMIVSKIVQISG